MEIITSLKISELEQLITDSVQKCLNNTLHPPKPEQPDLIGIDKACEITGWLKATIYKKSFTGEIPCSRLGKRLVFSRKELNQWMQQKTIRKQTPEEIACQHLSKVAK